MRIGQKLTLPLIMIATGNTITGILKNQNVTYYLLYVGLIIVFSFILSSKKIKISNNLISIILLILCVGSMFNQDISALNDVLFFTFATFISQRSKTYYMYQGIIYVVLLTITYTLNEIISSELMVHLAGVAFMLIIYQDRIHPKKESKYIIDSSSTEINKTVALIMQQYIQGYSWSEISGILKLNITGGRVQKIVKEEMIDKHFNNYGHLCHYLANNGIITAIDKNVIT
jgi:hypothetical protein